MTNSLLPMGDWSVACAKKNEKSEWWLGRLKDKIKNSKVHAIVLPVHVENEKYWVVIRINFENEEIVYGVSFIFWNLKGQATE